MRDDADPIEQGRGLARSVLIFFAVLAALFGGAVGVYQYRESREEQARSVWKAKLEFKTATALSGLAPRWIRLGNKGKAEELMSARYRAESEFMRICSKCAAADVCERDRVTVLSGIGSVDYNPCD